MAVSSANVEREMNQVRRRGAAQNQQAEPDRGEPFRAWLDPGAGVGVVPDGGHGRPELPPRAMPRLMRRLPAPRRPVCPDWAGLWHCGGVDAPIELPQEPSAWVAIPDAAERLGVPLTKIHQMIREGSLIAVRRDGVLRIPEELIAGRIVIKHLPGVLTLLRDAGFNDAEALQWLYSPDDSLPGIPAAALSVNGPAAEVKRRAQAMAT